MGSYYANLCPSNWSRTAGAHAFEASALAFLGLLLAVVIAPAMAQTPLVTNGSFAITGNPTGGQVSAQIGPGGVLCTSNSTACTSTETVAGWATAGFSSTYSFVFLPYLSTNTTAQNNNAIEANGYSGTLELWGPHSNSSGGADGPSANGFTAASPVGNGSAGSNTLFPGNQGFLGSDSDYQPGAVTQTINGLTVGKTYAVSFAWAAAQQSQAAFTAASQDVWDVSLTGGSTTCTFQTPANVAKGTPASGSTTPSGSCAETPVASIAGEGFSGWMDQTFDFVATNSSEVLSFLASGESTSGLPAFALLANVSMTQVPEPATWALMLTGLTGLTLVARRRRLPGPNSGNTI
jgi:hypothetical protein